MELIKDINPLSASSGPFDFTECNGDLYFIAYDFNHGYEIWKTDGTTANTQLIVPDSIAGALFILGASNNELYFLSTSPHYNEELFKTDGTVQNTIQLTFNPAFAIYDGPLIEYNGLAYFAFQDSINGDAIWSSDGTVQGTHLAVNLNQSGSLTGYNKIFLYNNKIYFSTFAFNGLFSSDGTQQGTHKIWNCGTGGCNCPVTMNGLLYFLGSDSTSSTMNEELYVSDGTLSGTHLVVDINPSGSGAVGSLLTSGGKLYFEGNDGIHGTELWASDGTASGTYMVKDINPGSTGSNPINLASFQNKLVFGASPKSGLNGFWISDGTSTGTVMLDTILVGSSSAIYQNKFFFSGNKNNLGNELCVSDGTEQGTGLFTDINPGTNSSSPSLLTNYKNLLIFNATTTTTGYEPFKLQPIYKLFPVACKPK